MERFKSWIEAAAYKNILKRKGLDHAVVCGSFDPNGKGFYVQTVKRRVLSLQKPTRSPSQGLKRTSNPTPPRKEERLQGTLREQLQTTKNIMFATPEPVAKKPTQINIKKSRKIY